MQHNYIKILGIIILLPFSIFAQNTLSGNIKNIQTQDKLTGVSVYLSDLKRGALSDSEGNYRITNLKPGNYLLEIGFIGYKSIVKKVALRGDTTLNFEMTEATTEMSEVIVTGVSRSTEIKLSPVIVKTIDRSTLNQSISTNLIDAMKNVPGFNQITTGAGISKPVIRGLGYNRIITLHNGIRQEGQQWGDEHGIEIDEYAIERAEIVKGPGSLMYGSDGIAGVINFLSPKSPPLGHVNSQIISNYQSNNNLVAWSASNAGHINGIQWMGRLTQKLSGNYKNVYDGKVLNSGFREFDGTFFGGINKSWGHTYITLSSFHNELNLPEGERDSTGQFIYVNNQGEELTASKADYSGYKTGFPHQVIDHARATLNQYLIFKTGTLNADLGFQNNRRRELADPVNPRDVELFFDLNTFNYNFRYNFQKTGKWETSAGLGGMQQSNQNKGEEFLIPDYNLFDAGAFVFTQANLNKLTLAGGLRYDMRQVNSSALFIDSTGAFAEGPGEGIESVFNRISQKYDGISGSFGISYQTSKNTTLKFNVSRGFRAPNISELASNGRHEGTFRYEIGDPTLKSEISHQFDLAFFIQTEHVNLELTPFINLINHYIYTSRLSSYTGSDSIPDPMDPAPAFKFSSGKATLLGGEVFLDIHPHPLDWLHIENSFSYVEASQSKVPDSLMYLPFIPAPHYRGELKAQLKIGNKVLTGSYFKIGLDYFFKQNRIYSAFGTETATPDYFLISSGLGTTIKMFHKRDFLNLYLVGENLADVAYQSHLSRLKYAPQNPLTGRTGIFNMGRNISLKAEINF